MKYRFCCSFLVAALGLLAASTASADQPFLYVDEMDRLPPEPGPHPVFGFQDSLDVEMVDVDADGDLDLFYAEGSAGPFGFQNNLFINDGAGFFTNETAARLPVSTRNSSEVAFADVDCDGDLDVATSNLGPNELWLNNGAGVFTDVSGANLPPTPTTPPWAQPPFFFEISAEVAFFDADNDGDQDLFVSNENPFNPVPAGGAQNRLLINSGDCSGVYVENFSALPVITDQTSGVQPYDLEGDGDLDLIVLDAGPNYVLRNNLIPMGYLSFTRQDTILPAVSTASRKGEIADLDGDGCIDLFEANSREERDNVYFGDCTGTFVANPLAMPALVQTNTDVDLVDLDGDGDLDAYTTSPGGFLGGHGFLGGQNRYFVNDGNGFFEEHTFPNFPTFIDTSTNSAFGDVDGDGDLDLAVANSGAGPLNDPNGRFDRLLIRHSCESEGLYCLGAAVDAIEAEIAGLDTTPGAGDMTSQFTLVNKARKHVLESLAGIMQHLLDHGLGWFILPELILIERRVDGAPSPPDWVTGDAANILATWIDFAYCVFAQ